MAQGKKSFIAYSDWKEIFDELPNEDAGILIKHIFAYVNDENPTSDSLLIRAVFANIKTTLKRDLSKWDSQLEQRKEAGKRSAEIRKQNATSVNERSNSSTDNVSDSVNVNVNVSANVNENNKSLPTIKIDIDGRKLKFASTLQPFLTTYGKDFLNDFYKYWTEPNKSNTKFKQELEKTWSLERRLETWAKNEKNFERKVAPKETKSEERSKKNLEIMNQSMEILKQRQNGTITSIAEQGINTLRENAPES